MNDVVKFAGLALFPNFASIVVMAISGIKGSACPRTAITPPGWVFGVVWPVLYLLVGVVMARMELQKRSGLLIKLFWLVLGLNLWYVAFAPKCYPLAALVGIVLALVGTVWVTVEVFHADAKTGRLMLPLCAWLTFATVISAKVLHDSRVK
jgi:tryptophan-rich sensory protein